MNQSNHIGKAEYRASELGIAVKLLFIHQLSDDIYLYVRRFINEDTKSSSQHANWIKLDSESDIFIKFAAKPQMTAEMQPVCRLDVYHVLYGHTPALRVNKQFVSQSGHRRATQPKEGTFSVFPKQKTNYLQYSIFTKQKAHHYNIV